MISHAHGSCETTTCDEFVYHYPKGDLGHSVLLNTKWKFVVKNTFCANFAQMEMLDKG